MIASIIKINGYNPFKALMLREYWENRRAIFMTPLVITGLFMFIIVVAMGLFGKTIHIDGEAFSIGQFVADMSVRDAQELQANINHLLIGSTMPIVIGAWFCMVFTALGSLYDERKDNSILFWKSMPVSDLQTVVSKLLTVMLIIPLVALAFTFVFQVFLLIVGSFATIGTEYSAWDLLWTSTNIPALLLAEFSAIIMYGLWALPIFAWFMLASVLAKRTPLLLATIPVALTMLLEGLFFNTSYLLMFIAKRLSINLGEGSRLDEGINELGIKTSLDIFQTATQPAFWMGLGIATILLYAVILLRKRNSL